MMGRMVYFTEDPGVEPLVLRHPKMEGVKWYPFGDWKGCSDLYYFCKDILKGPWKPAETVMIENSRWAYIYANYLDRRWIEAEPAIKQNVILWKSYCQYFSLEKYSG